MPGAITEITLAVQHFLLSGQIFKMSSHSHAVSECLASICWNVDMFSYNWLFLDIFIWSLSNSLYVAWTIGWRGELLGFWTCCCSSRGKSHAWWIWSFIGNYSCYAGEKIYKNVNSFRFIRKLAFHLYSVLVIFPPRMESCRINLAFFSSSSIHLLINIFVYQFSGRRRQP